MTWNPYLPMWVSPFLFLHVEDAAGEVAALEVRDRAIDVAQRVLARDQLVDLEPPAEIELRQHREVVLRTRRAVATAEDRAVEAQRVDQEVGARVELRHADDGQRAARSKRRKCLLDRAQAADRL